MTIIVCVQTVQILVDVELDHAMRASSGADTPPPILSGRWMLHILDVRTAPEQPPQLVRRGMEPDAVKLDLAETCRGYADAIIIDLVVRRLLGQEHVDGQGTIAKVRQAMLNVHDPDVKNWRMFESQLKNRNQNPGAFARAALIALEMDALANLVEWAAVLTACALNIGQANYQSAKDLSRPNFKPQMRAFGGRLVKWEHCIYAAFALASLWSELSSDDEWANGNHGLADDARLWHVALKKSASQRAQTPRQLLNQIVSKRSSILPHEEIREKLDLLNGDANNVDELLELDAARVSRELRTILKNAHVLRCSDHTGEES